MAYKANASTSAANVAPQWLNLRTADTLFPVGPVLLSDSWTLLLLALHSRYSMKRIYLITQLSYGNRPQRLERERVSASLLTTHSTRLVQRRSGLMDGPASLNVLAILSSVWA